MHSTTCYAVSRYGFVEIDEAAGVPELTLPVKTVAAKKPAVH